MSLASVVITSEIEIILRDDCPPMVFPLREDTLSKIEKLISSYGEGMYKAGRNAGTDAGMAVGYITCLADVVSELS